MPNALSSEDIKLANFDLGVTLIFWFITGLLGWAWANYHAYRDNPNADQNPKKWDMLTVMIIYGPIALLMVLIVGIVDRKLYFGLRFK